MQISIKDYNNIKELTYDIQDNKINFLFGISGCGKSSIAYALTSDIVENHIPIGKENAQLRVLVNGNQVNYEDFAMFDMEYMNDILIHKQKNQDIYKILVGDRGRIDQLKTEYTSSITNLLGVKDSIYLKTKQIGDLIDSLKIAYKQDGKTYKASCVIHKFTTSINDDQKKLKNLKKYSVKQIKWFQEGKETIAYNNSKCPFCNRKLSSFKKQRIDELVSFDATLYNKINNSTGIFDDLKITEPNWAKKKEVQKFNKEIKKYFDVKFELDGYVKYINFAKQIDISTDNLDIVKPSQNLKSLFPELYEVLDEFSSNLKDIKRKIGCIRTETDKLIAKNVKRINDKLDRLGISYTFVKKQINEEEKKAEFIITHLKENNTDRAKDLSFGEKNIIGLLLFLTANESKKCLVIDDPASSFDEYRRKVIFDYIYSFKKTNCTVLVLSHDHVFAKYAIYHYEKARNEKRRSKMDELYFIYTGNVDYIETFDECKISKINMEDFDSISSFIKKRINELPKHLGYQTAINLRLYYEVNKDSKCHRIIYGYLSGIVHCKPKADIINVLEQKGKTEAEIIKLLNEEFEVQYTPLPNNYADMINVQSFNIFEKLIYAREKINKKGKGKIIFDELSNIIHLNMAYAICLNPYKYNYFSKYVYDYLIKELNIPL